MRVPSLLHIRALAARLLAPQRQTNLPGHGALARPTSVSRLILTSGHVAIAVTLASIMSGCSSGAGSLSVTTAPAAAGQPTPTQGRPPDEVTPRDAREDPPRPGPAICEGRYGTNQTMLTSASRAHQRAAAAIDCDAHEIMLRVWSQDLGRAKGTVLYERVLTLREQALRELAADAIEWSRLPLSMPHRQMFEVAAEAERQTDTSQVRVWATNPWKPLEPLERLSNDEIGTLSTAVMRGERRAIALNLRSLADSVESVDIAVNLTRFPSSDVHVYAVNWTGTDQRNWVAAELQMLGDASRPRSIELLPGITKQVWIAVEPHRTVPSATYSGEVEVRSSAVTTRLPLSVEVFAKVFPERPSLHLGGWDYTDDPRPGYVVSESNRAQIIDRLQTNYVNLPWAHSGGVMHWKFLNKEGEVAIPVDRTLLERWVSSWPKARRFRVYVNATNQIAGIPTTDPKFATAVANWLHTWATEIRRLNRSPDEFDLLLVDEPQTPAQVQTTTAWADAIRRAPIGFRIWVDPWYHHPADIPPNLIDAVDTVAVNVPLAERAGAVYWEWARNVARQGKVLELYGTAGPARRLDPYAAYLLPSWRAATLGAVSISFWSFADTGGTGIGDSFSDHEFASPGYNYSPLFINRSEIRSGKHMEAIVQGLQDAEYVIRLKALAESSSQGSVRQRANELLDRTREFVDGISVRTESEWRQQSDSTQADALRISIGRFLDSAPDS